MDARPVQRRSIALWAIGIGAGSVIAALAAWLVFVGIPQWGIGRSPDDKAAMALIADTCGSCHRVPNVAGATGKVGPDLHGISRRKLIAGKIANNPANLRLFLLHPQAIKPGGAMPELYLTRQQADQIADYLIKHGG